MNISRNHEYKPCSLEARKPELNRKYEFSFLTLLKQGGDLLLSLSLFATEMRIFFQFLCTNCKCFISFLLLALVHILLRFFKVIMSAQDSCVYFAHTFFIWELVLYHIWAKINTICLILLFFILHILVTDFGSIYLLLTLKVSTP